MCSSSSSASRPASGARSSSRAEDRLDQLRFDLGRRAFTLRDRTGARVIVADSVPGEQPLADTDFGGTPLPTRPILDTLISPTPHTVRNGDEVITTQPLSVPPVKGDRNPPDTDFVLVTQKQLTDVATAVHQVRNAFVAAAAAGLAVAVLLGILLATGIGRRLARLRAAAVRVAEEGTDAPTPRDDGLDEVGDLARALATMQRELRRQEAARRSFVATASHELRTPLTSLQGTIELLEEDLRDGRLDQEDARRQVHSAQRELRRLGRLASELLDLSRLDADVALRDEPVELGELCRAVAAEFELRAAEARGRPRGPGAARAVLGQRRPRRRGARRAHPDRQRPAPCAVGLDRPRRCPPTMERRRRSRSTTTGPGVLPADRERIFERFERGSAPSGESGFGLGLAIGRELARKMGGELRIAESDGGASFVLELPIQLPAGSHPEPEAEPTPYMS